MSEIVLQSAPQFFLYNMEFIDKNFMHKVLFYITV